MRSATVGGRKLALSFTLDAMDQIERRLGMKFGSETLTESVKDWKKTIAILCILARAGAEERGEDPEEITEAWISKRARPGQLMELQIAVLAAIQDGMKMETEEAEEGAEEDVVLQELAKKGQGAE